MLSIFLFVNSSNKESLKGENLQYFGCIAAKRTLSFQELMHFTPKIKFKAKIITTFCETHRKVPLVPPRT